jgi:hypothetical protein
VTGPTGPTVTANNLSTGNNTPGGQNVAMFAALDLGTTITQNGTAIQRSGTTDITLAANQTYSICYNTSAILASVAGVGQASAALSLNGVQIAGTQSNAQGTAGNQTNLSACTIISTTTASTIQLINATNFAPSVTFFNTGVNAIKLA